MYKCNNLGKSVLIDDQINSAYDNVEYVAKHLPLMADLMSKIEVLKAFEPIMNMLAHMQNTDIHLSEEQVNQINRITEILADLDNKANDITSIWNDICDINQSLSNHFNNNSIHVSPEDREKWDNYATQISQIINNNLDLEDSLARVATTGSYNDLRDKPVLQNITIDNALSVDSHNPVENQVLTNKLADKVDRDVLHRVAFSGRYADLQGVPTGDTQLNPTSTNWATNQCVTEAIEDLSASIANAGLTEAQVRAIIQSELSAYKLDLFTIVSVLPQSGVEGIAYLVPIQGQNLKFNIYTWEVIDNTTNPHTYGFVQFGGGNVSVDLSNYYTKTEIDALLIDKSNVGHTHSYNDLIDTPTIPTKTSDLSNDSGFITINDVPVVTVPERTSDLTNDSGFITSDDLQNITVPTKTSDLTNDSGFITGVTWNDVSNKPTLAAVSTSGSYNDLTDKPTIPDVSSYYTKAEVDALINNAGISPSTNTLFGEPYSLVNSAEINLGNYEEVSND